MAAKQRTPRYRADKYTERQFEPYVRAIGRLALAWNALHELLGSTFVALTSGGPDVEFQKEFQSRQAWNSLRADLAQRQMLKAVVTHATMEQRSAFPRLVSDVNWLIEKVNGLSVSRNDAIHSPLILITAGKSILHWALRGPDYVAPDTAGGNEKALRLEKKELLAEFNRCYRLTLSYRDYTMKLNWALYRRHPWPDRPFLQLPQRKSAQSQTRPQDQKAARRRQPRSSQA
jgi:hypothetical protein